MIGENEYGSSGFGFLFGKKKKHTKKIPQKQTLTTVFCLLRLTRQ